MAIRQYPKERTLRLIRKAPQHAIRGSTKDGRQSALHTACLTLDSDIVEALLEKGALPNFRTVDGKTPLHCVLSSLDPQKEAYRTARLKIVTLLLSAGADTSAVDEDRNAALHLAILHGYLDCARLLIAHDDSSLTTPNKRGEIPLFVSATDQFSAASPMDMAAFLIRWHILNRPLHRAVALGDIKTVHAVLCSGEEISSRNMLGDAVLHLAAVRGDVRMVAYLVSQGASVDQKGYLGQSVLHRAAAACVPPHYDCGYGQPTYAYGMDAPVQKFWTKSEIGLFRSVSEYRQPPAFTPKTDLFQDPAPYIDVANIILNTGLSPSLPDALLRTPLHYAAAAGNATLVDLLLAHGADPNTPDLDLQTPPCHAAAAGHIDLTLALFQRGAALGLARAHARDVGHLAVRCGARCVSADMLNAADEHGRTPVVRAAQRGALAPVDYLLQAGAFAGQAERGWSPLVQACDRRHWEVARLLLARGANVGECEQEPRTSYGMALHLAARGGSSDTIREILRREARLEEQVDRKTEYSPTDVRIGFYRWTPLHFAASMGHKHAVGTLLSQMGRMEIIARDVDGFTAMELAEGAGYEEVVRLIDKRLS